jgi:hypothetical protein
LITDWTELVATRELPPVTAELLSAGGGGGGPPARPPPPRCGGGGSGSSRRLFAIAFHSPLVVALPLPAQSGYGVLRIEELPLKIGLVILQGGGFCGLRCLRIDGHAVGGVQRRFGVSSSMLGGLSRCQGRPGLRVLICGIDAGSPHVVHRV